MSREKIEELQKAWWDALRSTPYDLRKAGLKVAVHNDYTLDGKSFTFWLMTFHDKDKGITVSFKGEGSTDQEALDNIRRAWANYSDQRHHAPMCPANHYHGQRAPVGPCNCGADDGH